MIRDTVTHGPVVGPARRVIGSYRGTMPGPKLLCVGGIHGNEPAGVQALERVFEVLHRERMVFHGELIGLAGNLGALSRGRRFVREDLNRMWSAERIARLGSNGGEDAEFAELQELLQIIDSELLEAGASAHFVDLHTTSADTAPFAVIADTLRSRRFARHFPVPLILGLEEQVSGTITEYVENRGIITMGFEAGSHDDPRSVDRHEAAVWGACHAAGNIPDPCHPHISRSLRLLAEATGDLPRVLEVRHRHGVARDHRFRMNPGFRNFQAVRSGDVLASDQQGPIRAAENALILMPLYQEMGDDGFFLVRSIRGFWLALSTALRRLKVDRLVRYCPGVRAHVQLPNTFIVDRRIARWRVVEVFHLLGFRRRRPENDQLLFTRRVER